MEEIGRIVPRALKKHVQREEAPRFAVVAGLWRRVAGQAIAEQAFPVSFSAGLLTLTTASNSWAVQLQALSSEICSAVNMALGQPLVKRLRVRLGQPRESGMRESANMKSPKIAPVPPDWDELQTGIDASSLAGLDPEICRTLSHSFAKYFARVPQRIN